MARTKSLICFPKLNDCKGDLSKRWYVEYAFRLPNDPEKCYRYRTYDGLCSGTAEERYARARYIIEERTDWLKSGRYLSDPEHNVSPAKEAEVYRPEVKEYRKQLEAMRTRTLVERYLEQIKLSHMPRTWENYKSKLHDFCEYIEQERKNITVQHIDRQIVLDYLAKISSDRKLSTLSMEKYMQIVRAFFHWLSVEGIYAEPNPVHDVPKYGKIVDCAPVPFDVSDRIKLKSAMQPNSPWLWLACEMQYYCAIRPGTELRLLQIKDIDRNRGMIIIHCDTAKNNKTQAVSIPDHIIEQMEYLGVFNYSPDFYVFGKHGIPGKEPLGKNTMRNRFNRYREQLGISKDKKYYSWKHTGAIDAAEAGMPILQLKDHLRHTSVGTTEVYLRKRRPSAPDSSKWLGML